MSSGAGDRTTSECAHAAPTPDARERSGNDNRARSGTAKATTAALRAALVPVVQTAEVLDGDDGVADLDAVHSSWPSTTKPYKSRNVSVGMTKKSMPAAVER